MRRLPWVLGILTALTCSAADQDALAGKRAANEQAEIFRKAAKAIAPSVVNVTAMGHNSRFSDISIDKYGWPFFVPPKSNLQPRGIGSGFIFDAKNGYLLTNSHVVAAGTKWIVRLSDQREMEAKLIGTDPQTDVAVLQIPAENLTAAQLGDSDALEVGDWVLAVGNPFGLLEQTVTAGIISAKGRHGLGLSNYENYLQTDAAINMGNSGGPLVNLDGEVVGMNVAILSASGGYQGIGFAIPSNQFKEIARKLVTNGKIVRGWLAVQTRDSVHNDGATIEAVLRGGPAHKAGLLPGDRITRFDGHDIHNSAELRDAVAGTAPDTTTRIEFIRGKEKKHVQAVIGKQPMDLAAGESNG